MLRYQWFQVEICEYGKEDNCEHFMDENVAEGDKEKGLDISKLCELLKGSNKTRINTFYRNKDERRVG